MPKLTPARPRWQPRVPTWRPRPHETPGRAALSRTLIPALTLLALAVLTRAPLYGDPLIHVDETFYNLVGERMLRGAVPFVDIWDRKPIGLFLIYAGAHLALGKSVLAYQILATLFAAATAFLIARLAQRIASPQGALLAGVAYLLGLALFRCSGGQSPVFYNLLMVGAVELALPLLTRAAPVGLARRGALVMLVIGLALQIKYTVVFEGLGFGLALMAARWRLDRRSLATLGCTLLWIASALLPTALALGWYAWAGEAQAFVWANFVSIFGRDTGAALSLDRITDLATDVALTAPFWGALAWLARA
ncbi:glycosyltransferase family 39 protein, partial [Novosphingobium sp. 1949]|nr:glycosyltransferase family 39 protein [Novosphingobium organovorum]